MSTIVFPLFREDAENVLTPARRQALETKWKATVAAQERRRELSYKQAHGVLPKESKRHRFNGTVPGTDEIAGVLFANGEIHVFNRDRQLHYRYVASIGREPIVSGGGDQGDNGWAFSIYGNVFSQYMVPGHLAPKVEEVLRHHGFVR